jgi:hypothetical protein
MRGRMLDVLDRIAGITVPLLCSQARAGGTSVAGLVSDRLGTASRRARIDRPQLR